MSNTIKMENDESNKAPFNMALSVLDKINKILIEIKKASVYKMQDEKYQMVLQFHIQSIPLISNKEGKKRMTELKTILRNITPGRRSVLMNGYFDRYEPCFNRKVDFELDDVLEEIQVLLQNEGYFMPSKDEEDVY